MSESTPVKMPHYWKSHAAAHLTFRWTAIGWPHKIEHQMEQTYIQLEEDEERFRKLQTSDQANFNDRLDTLQV